MEINLIKLKKYGEHISVLYVEDDELIREQTKRFLERFFSNIEVAVDGVDGLNKFKIKKYDFVVTDINMPNMNGIEMIKGIREIIPHQIVLVTSAYNDSEHLMQLINLEVVRFVSKPFENKPFLIVLYKIVEELMQEKNKKELEDKIIRISKRSQTIVDEVNIGIVVINNNEVEIANKAFLNIGEFDSIETLLLEMPDIGVLFEDVDHCINAPSNAEFISQLQSAKEDEKKVRIIKNSETYEYRVSYKKVLHEENTYILTFTDITAIHNALFKDEHTNLPIKKFILEKLETYQKTTSKFKIALLSIRNFKNIVKWYGKNEAIEAEIDFANQLKNLKDKYLPKVFIGHFGQNQFIIIQHFDDSEEFYENVKKLKVTSLHVKENHKASNIDFNLSCKSIAKDIDSRITLETLEVDIINMFDDLS